MKRMLNLVILTGIVTLGIVFADPPDWSVNPSEYEQTASMTGILVFDGIQSDGPDDMIAAFVGDECRGVDDQGLYFSPTEQWVWGITLYSNGGDETFTFKGYDASEESEYDITDFSYTFVPDDIVGSSIYPVEWEFTTMDLPDWSVNPSDFEHTASMTGIVFFDGEQSDDPNDMVAAFVGDECRGVDAQGIYFPPSGQWIWGITLYANEEGEPFTFKGYDASEGLEYDITNFSYTFVPDDIVGSA
ncbi:MAG TPA: hypothetical protein QF698_05675, partial [Candidatus Marinimicrobia bacterium]|nr:hypothetical protein [Candidatus Neomarinimicrobiota bacterium]